jgi:large subunit ribosomal protein L15
MPGLHQLKPAPGSRERRKRVGRGDGSNRGSYSGRGSKGQLQTGKVPFLFEGGQNRLIKRLPFMRGFTNVSRIEYTPVNVGSLGTFDEGTEIGPDELIASGLVRNSSSLIKLLGDGEIGNRLHVTVHACSASARGKVEAAGGSVTVLSSSSKDAASSS